MKKMILAAFAAFALVAGIAQVANAQLADSEYHSYTTRNAAGNTGWHVGG